MPRVFQDWGQAMRTTATLDDALLARAKQLCGDLERSPLLKEALRALVQRESAKRLTALGGSDAEVLLLIERDRLMGRCIGDVDAHLLASVRLSHCQLWTQDRRLTAVAQEQGLGGRQPERE